MFLTSFGALELSNVAICVGFKVFFIGIRVGEMEITIYSNKNDFYGLLLYLINR